MNAFRCRMARRIGSCLDAELMRLDVPRCTAGREAGKQAMAPRENRAHRRRVAHLLRDRREPPLDAAKQLVVFTSLIVWRVRLTCDCADLVDRVHAETATPIAALRSVLWLHFKIIPAAGDP